MNAQVNTNSINIPNTGANTTPPPLNTYTSQSDNLSNPSNSTVPGANGSYSVDPAKPSITSPNTGTFTSPSSTQAPATYSPQSGNSRKTKRK